MEEGGLDKAIIGVGINLQGGSDAIPSELKEKMIYKVILKLQQQLQVQQKLQRLLQQGLLRILTIS